MTTRYRVALTFDTETTQATNYIDFEADTLISFLSAMHVPHDPDNLDDGPTREPYDIGKPGESCLVSWVPFEYEPYVPQGRDTDE